MADKSRVLQGFRAQRELANSVDAQIRALEIEAGISDEQLLTKANAAQEEKSQAEEGMSFKQNLDAFQKQSVAGEIVVQAAAGATDAAQELGNFALDVTDWVENFAAEQGVGTGDLINYEEDKFTFSDDAFPEPQGLVGALSRGVSNFVVPFAGGMKVIKIARNAGKIAKIAKGALIGAGVDFAAFDPHEARLSNLIQEQPLLRNPVAAWLAAEPGDTNAEGRFKNAVEGLGLGALTEGLFLTLRGIKAARRAKNLAKIEPEKAPLKAPVEGEAIAVEAPGGIPPKEKKLDLVPFAPEKGDFAEIIEAKVKVVDIELGRIKKEISDINLGEQFFEDSPILQAQRIVKEVIRPLQIKGRISKESGDLFAAKTFAKAEELAGLKRKKFFVDTKDIQKFIDTILPKEAIPIRIIRDVAAPKGMAININLNKLSSSKEVKDVIANTAELFSKEIDESRRGAITEVEQLNLARDLDTPVENLIKRQEGQALNAEQLLASRKILNVSAQDVLRKAKSASKGSNEELAAFLEALDAHRIVQAQVSGAVAEAGRALRSQRILVGLGTEAQQTKMLKEIIEAMGGQAKLQDLAGRIAEFSDVSDLSKFNRKSLGRKLGDAAFEVWINGLLSGPKTHIVNLISNLSVIGAKIPERVIGATISKVTGSNAVRFSEVGALVKGAVDGFNDGVRVAAETLRRGESRDAFTKLDLAQGRAVSAEAFDASGKVGKAIDLLGEVIRIPGRALMASDDLMKAINYRMETHALSAREAAGLSLSGEEFNRAVKFLVDSPPDSIKLKSLEEARASTFTKPLTGVGVDINNIIKKVPGARLLAPFVRTNLNLLEFAGERTPGLNLFFSKVRADLAAGGARRDMALAKASFGGMMITGAIGLASQGLITGGGPANVKARKILEQAGWQPYSIRVGDEFFSYDRLDPFGSLIGLAADFADIGGHLSDGDLDDVGLVLGALIGNFLTPEFLTESMGSFLDVMENPEKAGKNFLSSKAATAVPFSSLLRTIRKEIDPVKRVTRADPSSIFELGSEIINKFKNTIPGWSKDLPPQRNIFGEIIHYAPGFGPDIASPIATRELDKSPAWQEIIRLGISGPIINPEAPEGEKHLMVDFPSKIISKKIGGIMQAVELTPEQYDRLIVLSAGIGLKGAKLPLKERLEKEILKSPYKGSSDAEKRIRIKTIINSYRTSARLQIQLEEKNIIEDFREKGQQRLEAIRRKP